MSKQAPSKSKLVVKTMSHRYTLEPVDDRTYKCTAVEQLYDTEYVQRITGKLCKVPVEGDRLTFFEIHEQTTRIQSIEELLSS